MAKLRKMLGHADDPGVVALMRLIETQSHATLVTWGCSYAEESVLPVYESAVPNDGRPRRALEHALAALNDRTLLSQAKTSVKEARAAAKEAAFDPAAQAACQAAATAAAILTTPTNALGMAFYCAAALAYRNLGTDAQPADYDRAAAATFDSMLASLRAVAVPDEPHPATIAWNC